jgi:hypothetical protein
VKIDSIKILKAYGLGTIIFVFILMQLANNHVTLTDTNVFLYTSREILHGKMLYRDLFFDNLPLSPYIQSLYLWLAGGSVYGFYFSGVMECAAIALLIYFIIRKRGHDYWAGLSGIIMWLFSVYLLITVHSQTGIFTAIIFFLAAYLALLNKKGILAGVLISASLLCKGYFLPTAAAMSLWAIGHLSRKELIRYITAGAITMAIGIVPFWLFTNNAFVNDVLAFAIKLRTGSDKTAALKYFATKDWLLFATAVTGLVRWKSDKLAAGVATAFALFFLWYKDFFHLYFGIIIPWACIWWPDLWAMTTKIRIKIPAAWVMAVPVVAATISTYYYVTQMWDYANVPQFEQMVTDIKEMKPNYLFGVSMLTPALAYATNVPLLDNVIATHDELFRYGLLDQHKMLRDAAEKGAVVVSYGVPVLLDNLSKDAVSDMFDKQEFESMCKVVKSYPIRWQSIYDRINLSVCKIPISQ